MGAWGHGNFENDAAIDWLAEVEERGAEEVRSALAAIDAAPAESSLETDACCAALAAAELVACSRGRLSPDLPEDARAWCDEHGTSVTDADLARARRVTVRIGRSSELQKLFDEGGRNSQWHAVLEDLERRLG